MTNEEAKAFLDNLKICIEEHPIVADWLVEIAGRKTEPQTDCNGCKFVGTYDTEFPCANCSRKTKDYYAKDEPQAERHLPDYSYEADLGRRIMEQTKSGE